MPSSPDQHDLDKLIRWHESLVESSGSFPVCAVFLVSQADQAAHNVFRAFRSSFEARNAGFENLVIFGQHGVSKTVHALLAEWGLAEGSLPVLVILAEPPNFRGYYLRLPAGDTQATLPSGAAEILGQVEQNVDRGRDLRLQGIAGMKELQSLPLGFYGDLPSRVQGLIENLG